MILLSVASENVPQVRPERRINVVQLGDGFFSVVVNHGFMETVNVPRAIKQCREQGLRVRMKDVSYYLGRETLLSGPEPGLAGWRKSLFTFLSRNARPATAFFCLPPDRVVELGMQVEL